MIRFIDEAKTITSTAIAHSVWSKFLNFVFSGFCFLIRFYAWGNTFYLLFEMDTKLIVAPNFAQLKTMSKIKKNLNGKVNEQKGNRKKNQLSWNKISNTMKLRINAYSILILLANYFAYIYLWIEKRFEFSASAPDSLFQIYLCDASEAHINVIMRIKDRWIQFKSMRKCQILF